VILDHFDIVTDEQQNYHDLPEKIRGHLSKKPSFPMILGFCPRSENGTCLSYHEVAIRGIRDVCCDVKMTDCDTELEVVDWRKGAERGYYPIDSIITSLNEFSGGITYITPCSPEKSDRAQFPLCTSHILGPYPLHYLIRTGDLEASKELLRSQEHLLQINKVDTGNRTPLTEAISLNQIEIVKFLLESGAKPDLVVPHNPHLNNSVTPLDEASGEGLFSIVEQLIYESKRAGHFHLEDRWAVQSALRSGHFKIASYLIENGVRFHGDQKVLDDAIKASVDKDYPLYTKMLLRMGANPNFTIPSGKYSEYSLLQVAISKQDTEFTRELLKMGADPNYNHQTIFRGSIPNHDVLDLAFKVSNFEIAQLLLEKNKDYIGNLKAAILKKDIDQVKFILQHASNKEVLNDTYTSPRKHFSSTMPTTALHAAAETLNFEITLSLVRSGAKETFHPTNGSPLSAAIRQYLKRNLENKTSAIPDVIALLSEELNVNSAPPGKMSPLGQAIKAGHVPLVRLLVSKGADPMHVGLENMSDLEIAKKLGNLEILKELNAKLEK
jgi:ankyrin repeat protein